MHCLLSNGTNAQRNRETFVLTAFKTQVIKEWREKGFDFLEKVFNTPSYLEDLTGLTQLKQSNQDVSIDWEELSDEEL